MQQVRERFRRLKKLFTSLFKLFLVRNSSVWPFRASPNIVFLSVKYECPLRRSGDKDPDCGGRGAFIIHYSLFLCSVFRCREPCPLSSVLRLLSSVLCLLTSVFLLPANSLKINTPIRLFPSVFLFFTACNEKFTPCNGTFTPCNGTFSASAGAVAASTVVVKH